MQLLRDVDRPHATFAQLLTQLVTAGEERTDRRFGNRRWRTKRARDFWLRLQKAAGFGMGREQRVDALAQVLIALACFVEETLAGLLIGMLEGALEKRAFVHGPLPTWCRSDTY